MRACTAPIQPTQKPKAIEKIAYESSATCLATTTSHHHTTTATIRPPSSRNNQSENIGRATKNSGVWDTICFDSMDSLQMNLAGGLLFFGSMWITIFLLKSACDWGSTKCTLEKGCDYWKSIFFWYAVWVDFSRGFVLSSDKNPSMINDLTFKKKKIGEK